MHVYAAVYLLAHIIKATRAARMKEITTDGSKKAAEEEGLDGVTTREVAVTG